MPPENIAPGSSETIHVLADSSYLFTGLEGWVVYCTKSISSPPHAPKSLLKRTRSNRAMSSDEKNAPVKPMFGSKGPKPKPVTATASKTDGSPERTSLTGSGKSILRRSRSYSVGDIPTTFNNVNQNNIEVNANNINLNNGLMMDEEGQIIHVKNVTFAPEELAKGLKENHNVLREPKRLSRALAKSSPANLAGAEKNTTSKTMESYAYLNTDIFISVSDQHERAMWLLLHEDGVRSSYKVLPPSNTCFQSRTRPRK